MALVERTYLTPGTDDFQAVSNLFISGLSHHIIQSIEKVQNYELEQKFKQRKDQYENTYGQVRVVKLWHGTKKRNVDSILRENFDVSRHGQNRGTRFGAGVSFSAFSRYAYHFCDQGEEGCMLLCEVLVSNITQVPENKSRLFALQEPPLIPGRFPLRYDTTAKNKDTMDVIVKFDSDSFRPTHIVHFKKKAANLSIPRAGVRAATARATTFVDLLNAMRVQDVEDDVASSDLYDALRDQAEKDDAASSDLYDAMRDQAERDEVASSDFYDALRDQAERDEVARDVASSDLYDALRDQAEEDDAASSDFYDALRDQAERDEVAWGDFDEYCLGLF
ncbi:protein mono-ADP-ribosyltransferase PARP12-like isoform X1 [Frankliniella occidentalis]|uniref:Poly [ADP-ribose] polymerase n=1 Tax=Frankliniella occidentalis TaxID=133901 RepID=A0A6J1SFJ7_FRAOC|nr:protein mono-ADP-ribosyltransferase PARP12-like isoform X1 [Frankliniella occidentalis]